MRHAIAVGLALALGAGVKADVAGPPAPGPERIALADFIGVVRVVGFEPQDVEAKLNGQGALAKHRVAAVQVVEPLKGPKDAKTIRVAFVPPMAEGPRFRPNFNMELQAGKVGILFVRKHPGQDLYYGTLAFDFVEKLPDDPNAKNPPRSFFSYDFPSTLADAKRRVKLLDNLTESLKSKDAAERHLTAQMLVARYRTARGPGAKQEPISADETKQIVSAILSADWKQPASMEHPFYTFSRLGLTAKDGWTQPARIGSLAEVQTLAQTWFMGKGQDYRLLRFVD